MIPHNRAEDKGVACWLAMRCSQLWDWVDKRQIDKHIVSIVILYGTWVVTRWAMAFANEVNLSERNGIESAALIAAVTAPYMALQAAAIGFYFKARQ